jgi:hypothetical protein
MPELRAALYAFLQEHRLELGLERQQRRPQQIVLGTIRRETTARRAPCRGI